MKLTELWNKTKQNKGKLGLAALATFIATNVFEFNPRFKDTMIEAKEAITAPIVDVIEGKPDLKKVVEEDIKPTKEDFTASEYIGISVRIDGEWKRLVLSIKQRDILMGISDDLAYIKREGGAQQVDILLLLDCQKRFGEKEELYERCVDMVFEDFEGGDDYL